MVDLTTRRTPTGWPAGARSSTDRERARLRGDVVAQEGRRFIVIRTGLPDEHDADNPLSLDVEAQIFDAETRTLHDPQLLGTLLAHNPRFESVDGVEVDGDV